MRLPRKRKGTTAIDIGLVDQGSGPRVRLSMGREEYPNSRVNTDLSLSETEDLIVLLQYHVAKAKGEVA